MARVDGIETAPWIRVVESGQTLRIPVTGPHSDDMTIAAPLIGNDGVALGAVVVTNRLGNVAGFKDADLETLETFAAQIAVSVANSQLIDSLAEANALAREQESLIRAKDEFIASVSHELRTPLTTVLGLSQELVTPAAALAEEERAELTELIAEQSMELAFLVDDLLVSARADIGTLDITNDTVDLAAEIRTVLREVRGGDAVEVRGAAAPVWADGLRLRQIVRNLVSNAYRYGGDEVRMDIAQSGMRVTLAVIDNGTGVEPGREDEIFQAYGRAHEPGTQPASIGLGLHVARRLAHQMGGDLTYERRTGETRFELTLRAVV
jgi:K+-sensing histidine kinase KdpD